MGEESEACWRGSSEGPSWQLGQRLLASLALLHLAQSARKDEGWTGCRRRTEDRREQRKNEGLAGGRRPVHKHVHAEHT